jgi:hypothetical protein
VIPTLLLSLVTAIQLLAQSSANVKSKSSSDNWDSPMQAAPEPQGSKPGKSDTKNVADGAAKGQASEGVAPNPNGGSGGGKGNKSSANVHKNIADGAAKGQATDGIIRSQDASSPGKTVADGAAKGQATEGVVKPYDAASPPGTTISDGAAKGQANERIVKERDMSSPDKVSGDGAAKGQAQELTLSDPNPNGGSGGKGNNSSVNDHKNISDGAAKSQAVDGMVQNPNGGSGGGAGKSDSINYSASKSNTGNVTIHKTTDSTSPQADMAVKGEGVPENTKKIKSKSATDNWSAPTSTAPKPATGTTKGKSATDDWQTSN